MKSLTRDNKQRWLPKSNAYQLVCGIGWKVHYSTCIVHLCSQGLIAMLAYEMIMWTLGQLGRLSLVYIGT